MVNGGEAGCAALGSGGGTGGGGGTVISEPCLGNGGDIGNGGGIGDAVSGSEAGCVALLGSSADILEPCVDNGGDTGMVPRDGCGVGSTTG